MPKAKLAAVLGVQIQPGQGHFTIVGRDGAGRELLVELPMSSLNRLATEARRGALIAARKAAKSSAPGQDSEVSVVDVKTAAVGSLAHPTKPMVAIVFDHATETEVAFRLPPKGAREVGEMLIREVDKLDAAATEAPTDKK